MGKYPSQSKEKRKEYLEKNKESINLKRRQSYAANKEKYKEKNKKNYLNNKEKRTEYNKKYYLENKEKINKKHKEYRENNKEFIYVKNRARKLKVLNKINQSDIDNLIQANNNLCFYCGIIVVRGINLHLDHKIPLCKGGEHNIDNLVPSCKKCNLMKGTKSVDDFMKIIRGTNVC